MPPCQPLPAEFCLVYGTKGESHDSGVATGRGETDDSGGALVAVGVSGGTPAPPLAETLVFLIRRLRILDPTQPRVTNAQTTIAMTSDPPSVKQNSREDAGDEDHDDASNEADHAPVQHVFM